ncbi:magnesium chelatase subunit D [Sphingomonas sp. RS6]
MTASGDALAEACIAARLCAIDPGLGGMVLRGGGELRDAIVAQLAAALPTGAPIRRVPPHIDDERLLGGVDLTATLASGRAVSRIGLLAEADGGIVVLPVAERAGDALAGRLAAVLDSGALTAERDGVALRSATRFVLVAFDDGIGEDERAPASLFERTAFHVDLSASRADELPPMAVAPAAQLPAVPPFVFDALVSAAAALGIDSARAPIFALRAARAAAQLAGRATVNEEDVTLAARLVLAPRATRLPGPADSEPAEATESEPSPPSSGEQPSGETGRIEDRVLAAALAALPPDVLARIGEGGARRARSIKGGGAGERRKSPERGRPIGTRSGAPGGGRRLSLIDTLRAAAPWQRLRGRDGRILVRRDDLRIRRFETRAEALTIFAVDASGSSALARLAEAKGAVELLLAEAYVKRAQVALVAFRGTAADLVLPPTRSLTRARRSLAELPGGGGTPLAAGLQAARELAEAARARGRTPFVVVLTDGRANIAADGGAVRAAAEADAAAAARAIAAAGIAAAFVDISVRPRPEGAALAAAMRARYLSLPRADAATMHAAISAVQRG